MKKLPQTSPYFLRTAELVSRSPRPYLEASVLGLGHWEWAIMFSFLFEISIRLCMVFCIRSLEALVMQIHEAIVPFYYLVILRNVTSK